MKKVFNKNLILVLFISIFALGSIFIFKIEEKNLNKSISTRLNERAFIIKEYFEISRSLIYTLKNSLENNMRLFNQTKLIHPNFKTIKYYKQKNIFNTQIVLDKTTNITSSLNGIGKIENISKSQENEINSTLFLSSIFKTSLESIIDLEWIYYTSKSKFMYLAPTDILMEDKFLKKQYKKEFWTQAIPKNNPSLKLVITSLYVDGAGKGLMTTLSVPVIYKNNFRGIVSIDIGLSTLKTLISQDVNVGQIHLLNFNDEILATKTEFKIGEKLMIYKKGKNDDRTKEQQVIKLFDNKLKLVHSISIGQKNLIIFNKSFNKILLLLFILSISYMTIYLVSLVKKVEKLANIDPLTSLLNRRSIREKITIIIDVLSRHDNKVSFLMIDIDFFKKINDTYGHHMGDITLKKISKILKNHTRKSDLVSRYGGEEFLICLSNTNVDDAYILAEKIRLAVSNMRIEKIKTVVTISIGCVEYKKEESLDSAINRADILMYKAKHQGRNQTHKE